MVSSNQYYFSRISYNMLSKMHIKEWNGAYLDKTEIGLITPLC